MFKGSVISPKVDHTISSGIRKRRETAQIDGNHVLQEDVLFRSPSGAAMFVIGKVQTAGRLGGRQTVRHYTTWRIKMMNSEA